MTAPRAPITIGIIVTFMFHSYFNSQVRSKYLYLFYIISILLIHKDSNVPNHASSLFLLIIIRSGCLAGIGWSVLYLQIPENFVCVILQDIFWVVHIPFVHIEKFPFLAHFPWITMPTQSWLVLYSLEICCIRLWFLVSSLSSHNVHLLFCCALFVLALI